MGWEAQAHLSNYPLFFIKFWGKFLPEPLRFSPAPPQCYAKTNISLIFSKNPKMHTTPILYSFFFLYTQTNYIALSTVALLYLLAQKDVSLYGDLWCLRQLGGGLVVSLDGFLL